MRHQHFPASMRMIQFLISFSNDTAMCGEMMLVSWWGWSGGAMVLDYQSRDLQVDPPLLRSFGGDFKPKSRLRMTSLLVEC